MIVSGDSDFSPLVSKLKENGKHVIGLGMKDSTSELLRDNCDEFIYYEDLERQEQADQQIVTSLDADLPERKRKVFALLLESLLALRRENKEVLYASMIKDTMKRKKPSFNESYYGYRTFSELLEDADNLGAGRHRAQPQERDLRGDAASASARPPSSPRKARRPRARVAWSGSMRPGRGIASRRPRSLDAARKPGVSGPPTDGRPMVDHLPRCRGPGASPGARCSRSAGRACWA